MLMRASILDWTVARSNAELAAGIRAARRQTLRQRLETLEELNGYALRLAKNTSAYEAVIGTCLRFGPAIAFKLAQRYDQEFIDDSVNGKAIDEVQSDEHIALNDRLRRIEELCIFAHLVRKELVTRDLET